MEKKQEVLLPLYLDDIAFARHHENLRSGATNLILIIGGALGGIVAIDSKVTFSDLPLALFLMAVGFLGAVFCYKHYERFHSHYQRAREIRERLGVVAELDILDMKRRADEKHAINFPVFHKISLGWLWTALPLSVSFLGFIISLMAVCGS